MKKSSADFSDSTVVFDSGKNKKAKKNIVNDIFEFVELIAIAFAIILIISAFFFRHSVVSGGSMMKTLKDGEHLIISDFLYEPKFSDIVVFQLTEEQADLFPHISKSEPLIKRVIATEGQRVKIVGGRVYVNGNELIESYVYRDGIESVTDMDEITVSEGHVFVMGDHRNDSLDSRAFGEIDMRLILGRVVLRFLPIQSFGSVK
jgi:signal peptidase I